MSKCPYTWVRGLLGVGNSRKSEMATGLDPQKKAETLRVVVSKMGEVRVDVSLPAHSARWLLDLIPAQVLDQIRREQIPIEELSKELKNQSELFCSSLFISDGPDRRVEVWLE